MYGLVNKAVVDLVCSKFGEETWERIKEKAGVDDDVFVSLDPYPDDLTYRLVGAASEVLGITGAQVLEAFGEYWVLYTAKEGYGELLKASGKTLKDFLVNLDQMHARIAMSMPSLRPPKFNVGEGPDGSMILHYYSTRQGLAPMVVGLLKGLAQRFGEDVTVTLGRNRESGHDHDEFSIVKNVAVKAA